jgi:hypothetical protein
MCIFYTVEKYVELQPIRIILLTYLGEWKNKPE